MALGADDPLLFGSRLVAQYEVARTALGFSDEALAELARSSVRGSCAPEPVRARLLAGIDAWLARPTGSTASLTFKIVRTIRPEMGRIPLMIMERRSTGPRG